MDISFSNFNKCGSLLEHFNPHNPSGYVMYNHVKNYKFLILSWMHLCVSCGSKENSIDHLVYNREWDCLLHGTDRGFLHYLVKILSLGRTIATAIGRRPLTAEVRVHSHWTCGGQSGTRTMAPSTLAFPCQYFPTSPPYSSSSKGYSFLSLSLSLSLSPSAITPQWVLASFTRFVLLDHTQRHITVGRTPLDEWSARRRDLYLTTHNTHNRQTSMLPVGFEPTISAGKRGKFRKTNTISKVGEHWVEK